MNKYIFIQLFIYLFIYLVIHLFVCLFIYLYIYLFILFVLFILFIYFLRIWSHLLEKSLMEYFIFCAGLLTLLCLVVTEDPTYIHKNVRMTFCYQ